jgi:hypothetical protein
VNAGLVGTIVQGKSITAKRALDGWRDNCHKCLGAKRGGRRYAGAPLAAASITITLPATPFWRLVCVLWALTAI